MKKLSVFLLASTLLASTPSYSITPISGGLSLFGHTLFSEVATHVGCWNIGCHVPIPGPCTAICAASVDLPYAWSIWIDFATAAATALDAAATWAQNDRTIDAEDAVAKLEDSLKAGCSGGSQDDTSLDAESMNVYAPQIVVDALNDNEDLDGVRAAVEDYVFESEDAGMNGDCKDSHNKCAENRQNMWALLSVTLAEAMGDKIISNSQDMSGVFDALASQFSSQTSPMGMWGAMNKMTVDTQIQMNDLNALYARDLEMSALGGLNNSGTVEFVRVRR